MLERSYDAETPEVAVTTTTIPNFAPAPVMTEEEIRALAAMRANPDVAKKMLKIADKSESEDASAVRGKVTSVIEEAQRAALELAIKPTITVLGIEEANPAFIEGAREYMVRVGKITTTAEIAPDGELQVATKSPRRKQEGSESTVNA